MTPVVVVKILVVPPVNVIQAVVVNVSDAVQIIHDANVAHVMSGCLWDSHSLRV